MPRTPINYTNTHFYKIVCNDLNIKDCYVGHTTDFKRRRFQHKINTTAQTSNRYNVRIYAFIRANGGWENFDMVLIETRTCENGLEACKIERTYMEDLQATLNSVIPSRTPQEHYQDNKELITERHRERRNNKKDEIIMKSMEYYTKHKECIMGKHVCECGRDYTRCHKLRHERTMFHQQYIYHTQTQERS